MVGENLREMVGDGLTLARRTRKARRHIHQSPPPSSRGPPPAHAPGPETSPFPPALHRQQVVQPVLVPIAPCARSTARYRPCPPLHIDLAVPACPPRQAANSSPLRPCKTPTAHRRRRRLRRRPGNEPPRNDAPALPHAALSRATAMRPRVAPPPRKAGVVSRTRGGGAVHAGCAAGVRDRGGVAGPRSCHGGGG
jgi:hypothetical protein